MCNTTFTSKSDYEKHIELFHKKKWKSLLKREVRHSNLSITKDAISGNEKNKRKKSMNPAKILDHNGLANAENRLIKTRYEHNALTCVNNNRNSEIFSSTSKVYRFRNKHNNGTIVTNCHTVTTITRALDNQFDKKNNKKSYYNKCKSAFKSNELHHCILPLQHHKKRKINTILDIVEIETDNQKIERALIESSQESQIHTDLIISKTLPCLHPIVNDPNYYCRVCHVSHSTREAYQNHLQTKHHVSFPSSSTVTTNLIPKREIQSGPAVTRPNKLCKMVPIQINFDPKLPFSSSNDEQIRNANILPDLDDPNHYCKPCHITKPNRTSYLVHLSMMHKITRKKKCSKAPNVK